jgi:hypothetical protein
MFTRVTELSQYLRLPEKIKTRMSKFFQKYIQRGQKYCIWVTNLPSCFDDATSEGEKAIISATLTFP